MNCMIWRLRHTTLAAIQTGTEGELSDRLIPEKQSDVWFQQSHQHRQSSCLRQCHKPSDQPSGPTGCPYARTEDLPKARSVMILGQSFSQKAECRPCHRRWTNLWTATSLSCPRWSMRVVRMGTYLRVRALYGLLTLVKMVRRMRMYMVRLEGTASQGVDHDRGLGNGSFWSERPCG